MSPKKEQKRYERLKTEAEEELWKGIQDFTIKIGSQEYKDICSDIEYYDTMASRYATAYDENN